MKPLAPVGDCTASSAGENALSWSVDGTSLRVDNDYYTVAIDLSRGVCLKQWRDSRRNVSLLASEAAVARIELTGDAQADAIEAPFLGPTRVDGWKCTEIATDETNDGIVVDARLVPSLNRCQCVLWMTLRFDEGRAWTLSIRAETSLRCFQGYIDFPLLGAVRVGGDAGGMHSLLPTSAFDARSRELPVSVLDDEVTVYASTTAESRLPSCFWNEKLQAGAYLSLEQAAFPLDPAPARTLVGGRYDFEIEGESTQLLTVELGLCSHWKDMYRRWRSSYRRNVNSASHDRPEQAWYKSVFVCLFTFVFSAEIYDHRKSTYVLDRHLKRVRDDFGAVDAFIFWNSYPKLGIDERNQFELFDDIPGGREGLRALFDAARASGVRAFIPYIPWDAADPAVDHAWELARLVGDVGADGIHLDTTASLHDDFRRALDQRGLGHVVYMPERRPPVSKRMEAFRESTGSWAQGLPKQMPTLDLLRFVVPEHKVWVVEREAKSRRQMVEAAFFNGNGIILWERNFGVPEANYESANVYSDDDKALIRRCAKVWHDHRDALTGKDPEPLVRSAQAGIWVNKFPCAGKLLYTLYSTLEHAHEGSLVEVERDELERWLGASPSQCRVADSWNSAYAVADANGSRLTVCGAIGSHEVGYIVLEGPDQRDRRPSGVVGP